MSYVYKCNAKGHKFELHLKLKIVRHYDCPKCFKPGVKYVGLDFKVPKGLTYKGIGDA